LHHEITKFILSKHPQPIVPKKLWRYANCLLRIEERKCSYSNPTIGVNRIPYNIPDKPKKGYYSPQSTRIPGMQGGLLFFIRNLFYSATSALSAVQKNILPFSINILIF